MYKVITPPATLAVSLDEIKSQLNIDPDYTADDPYFNILISSAQSFVENFTKRLLVTQTVKIRVHHNNASKKVNGIHGTRGVYVPSPASAIVSIKSYIDDVEAIEDKDDFKLDNYTMPTVLCPKSDNTWTECDYYLIELIVGSALNDIPDAIKHAIMILAADAYENRVEQVRDRDNNVGRLLDRYRCTEFIDYQSTSNILQYAE